MKANRDNGVGKVIYDAVVRLAKEQGCYNVTLNIIGVATDRLWRFMQNVVSEPQK